MSKIIQFFLRFWVKYYLRRAKPCIVAITGSVGKTSTKEAIFEVLKVKFDTEVQKSVGNLNNETGVPLAIFGITKSPAKFYQWLPIIFLVKWRALFQRKFKIMVLEMAADKPGDIKYLTHFIQPHVAVLTSIAPAHLAAFQNIENIVKEKTELLRALPADGTAVLNIDDENLKNATLRNGYDIITYGIDNPADFMAKNITTEIEDYRVETKFQVVGKGGQYRVSVPTLGRSSNVYCALAAVSVGHIFNLSSEEITRGLSQIQTEKHRLNVLRGKNKTIIIDDSYNANPVSMKAALDVLKFLPDAGRKMAVLGEMLEIGQISAEAHQLIGEYAEEIADPVITVGEGGKKYQTGQNFPDSQEAIDYLLKNLRQNDMILVKASRAVALEKIVEALKEGN